MKFFEILEKDTESRARNGLIHTPHGNVRTPAFLPIGTRASVKTVTARELKFWGADIVLANTYHLWQRPGDALILKAGGLHKFMGWDGPVFTDSGGYQVFSLGEKRENLKGSQPAFAEAPSFVETSEGRPASKHGQILNISEKGVKFRSDIDGAEHLLTPEGSVQIQSNLGSDIALVLDFFNSQIFDEKQMTRAVDLTLLWAERSLRQYERINPGSVNPGQVLYGIVQGGNIEALRKKCAEKLRGFDFAGYGIGGIAIGGETADYMYQAVEATVPYLEEEKPRHLLGVGTPEQIMQSVARGCDTFDCVLPTRNARHGMLYVNLKAGAKAGAYETIRVTREEYKEDFTPVDNTCDCYLCRNHTRAYLRHLFISGEPLATRLATMHNLKFYLSLMEAIRRAIKYESFAEMAAEYRGAK